MRFFKSKIIQNGTYKGIKTYRYKICLMDRIKTILNFLGGKRIL
jgi:hypothetical protein